MECPTQLNHKRPLRHTDDHTISTIEDFQDIVISVCAYMDDCQPCFLAGCRRIAASPDRMLLLRRWIAKCTGVGEVLIPGSLDSAIERRTIQGMTVDTRRSAVETIVNCMASVGVERGWL